MSKGRDKDSKSLIEHVERLLQSDYRANGELHAALDGEETIQIASLKPERAPYEMVPSEILYWVDRSAYEEELEFCLLKHHEEAIEALKQLDLIPVFHDLVKAIERKRIVPFIGAGMSKPMGFPLWGEAIQEILGRVSGIDSDAVESELAAGNYEDAAQMIWAHDDTQVRNYIRTKFAAKSIPPSGPAGPMTLLPRLGDGCLITTNFDCVIEEIIGRGKLEGYMHGLQQGHKFSSKLIRGDRCILKLHGDAEDFNTYVLTNQQYEEGYGSPLDFSKPLPKALRQIYVSQSLLFLGCSLEQDRTLGLFEAVAAENQFDVPDHFALLPDPGNQDAKNAKESRLGQLSIRPIWYPGGEHDYVSRYLCLALDICDKKLSDF